MVGELIGMRAHEQLTGVAAMLTLATPYTKEGRRQREVNEGRKKSEQEGGLSLFKKKSGIAHSFTSSVT